MTAAANLVSFSTTESLLVQQFVGTRRIYPARQPMLSIQGGENHHKTHKHETTAENCSRYVHLTLIQLGYDIDSSSPTILTTAILSFRRENAWKIP